TMHRHQRNRKKFSGFTLLELLIVIGLIATLMTMSVVVMSGFLTTAEVEATSATIQKTFRLLEQRIDAFDRAFKGSRKQATIFGMRNLLASQQLFGVSDEAVEIMAKKALFRFEFPQRLGERLLFGDPGTVVPGMPDSMYRSIAAPTARQQLITEGNPTPTQAEIDARATSNWANHDLATESAELLYFTLVYSTNYGSAAVDSDRFTNREVADTDNDGLPEFIDAWGQPLRYYRWPTRLVDPNPPVPFQPILSDPSDPTDVVVPVDTDNDGIPDITIGQRQISPLERKLAAILLKGLPPAPTVLPNGVLPRDLLLTDPDDPVGILYFELERLNGVNGMPLFRTEFNEANYHTPDTFHAPLIVSLGKDGQLGLYEPHDTANFGNLAMYNLADPELMLEQIGDNITNRNKRAGGK
ncbi:MAG TPA: type II secretion system protein, partial [Planctomycetaceae bacterium]|nr:type II secretion system protein [Planctomycetaceae bacterium]